MIIFLTGPTGVGKTDTGWALLSARKDLVFLDCDWFASRGDFSWNDPADVSSVYRAIQSQIVFHIGEGRENFVITLTLEMARIFEAQCAEFAKRGLAVFAFRLIAAPNLIARRILERGRDQRGQELENTITQQSAFDALFTHGAIFTSINADGDAHEIARRIMDTIQN